MLSVSLGHIIAMNFSQFYMAFCCSSWALTGTEVITLYDIYIPMEKARILKRLNQA